MVGRATQGGGGSGRRAQISDPGVGGPAGQKARDGREVGPGAQPARWGKARSRDLSGPPGPCRVARHREPRAAARVGCRESAGAGTEPQAQDVSVNRQVRGAGPAVRSPGADPGPAAALSGRQRRAPPKPTRQGVLVPSEPPGLELGERPKVTACRWRRRPRTQRPTKVTGPLPAGQSPAAGLLHPGGRAGLPHSGARGGARGAGRRACACLSKRRNSSPPVL